MTEMRAFWLSLQKLQISFGASFLVVADRKEISERATKEGFYVIGVEHVLNRNEEFPGVKYIFSDIDEVDIDSFIKAYQRYAKEPWDVLTTDRLLVRETTLDDVDDLFEDCR